MKQLHKITIALMVCFSIQANAQSVELRPIAAYTFRETFPVYNGSVRINDGAMYGVALAYIADEIMDINFSYQIQSTTMDIQRYPAFLGDVGNKANIAFYQLGFNRNHLLPGNDKVIPYTGVKFGVLNVVFPEGKYENITRAAFGLNGGVKIMVKERIGLNLFALLQAPISGLGLSVTAGSGGVSTGVSTYSYALQFSLGGGLVFKLK